MRRDRLGRQARYAGYAALWLLIVIVMTAAGNGAGNHRARTSVDRITVDIDSPEGALLTEQIVREWVETEEYSPVGKSLDSIDLAMLEERISSHKAVARAEVSLNCDGSVDIDIRQRRPLMRLMVDGYDLYVSDDGYIFDAPAASTAYGPVVTGDYRPLFTPRYSGYSSDIVRDSIAAIERRIDELEREKIPFYRALQQNARSRKQLSAQRAHKGWFTSDEEYAVRREQVELYKAQRREELAAEAQLNQEQKDNLDLILSVPLEVAVEIGRTRRKIQDILSFSKGSLVVLDKLAGDQVDLLVNGQCVAKGDVVVIDDNFGIRITEILQKPDINVLTQG